MLYEVITDKSHSNTSRLYNDQMKLWSNLVAESIVDNSNNINGIILSIKNIMNNFDWNNKQLFEFNKLLDKLYDITKH